MKNIRLIVGTYTQTSNLDYIPRDVERRDGIYTLQASLGAGSAAITSAIGGIDNPSFLTLNSAKTIRAEWLAASATWELDRYP